MRRKSVRAPIDSPCYECRGLGGDYYIDENGELQDACSDCRFNETNTTGQRQTKNARERAMERNTAAMTVFSERLRELMKETKTTYRELANAVGCSHQTIYYALRDKFRSVGSNIAIGIADHFGVSMDWLFGLTDVRNRKTQDGSQGIVVKSDLDAGQIATALLDRVKTDELCLTITIVPDWTEIQLRPWGGASCAADD